MAAPWTWVHRWGVVAILLASHALLCSPNSLDIYMSGLPRRTLVNSSYGLEHLPAYMHQCNANGVLRPMPTRTVPDTLAYTPNRRLQADTLVDAADGRVQLGVMLVLGAHSSGLYDYGPSGSLNGLMAVWDSWIENFFAWTSNTTSLVLLLDERDFKKQNYTTDKGAYMDILLLKNMGATPADCAHLHPRGGVAKGARGHGAGGTGAGVGSGVGPGGGGGVGGLGAGGGRKARGHAPHGCNNKLALDQGYQVYYVDVAPYSNIYQKPLVIFVTVHTFPVPDWAKGKDEEDLFVNWRPNRLNRRFPTNYGYVKMTNWYAYHMLNLQILDFFDYAAKLDNDVSFVRPFPTPNLPEMLARQQTMMMTTQRVWYTDDNRIVQGTRMCLERYMDEESKRCVRGAAPGAPAPAKKEPVWLKPHGANSTILWEGNLNLTFRAHFCVFWLGLYAAPETKHMAKYWNDWHPRGMWDYRWGDQQWWPRPVSVFGTGNVSKDIFAYEELNTVRARNGRHGTALTFADLTLNASPFSASVFLSAAPRRVRLRRAQALAPLRYRPHHTLLQLLRSDEGRPRRAVQSVRAQVPQVSAILACHVDPMYMVTSALPSTIKKG